ncbi:hypothetical protein O181_018232 [Austropuccinia psidii MF-1]|uniref:Uncharacterized protein n=1 Tax=Austropuccinia psidii MF-1 TaxID=1389203 RepID=A0A9Q3C964_9BASI|nr:hypothetical protein [Austropuccinia psidii MF-1]
MAFLGHLGPLWLLSSVGHNHVPRSVGQLGPIWPNPMGPKGAKGGSPLAYKARWVPNHNWAHLSQFWPRIPSNPKWPSDPQDPILANNHHGPFFSPWPLVAARGNQIS